jgi:AsmA-like C-terminal region
LNNTEPASKLSTTVAGLRRRRALVVVFTLILILGAILLSIATRITPHVRQRAIAALNERFKSDVDLASLQVSIFPRPEILGTGVVLRHKGRTDVAPLIKIESYSASAGLWGLINSPLHLKSVELDRLEISIPPGGVHDDLADPAAGRDATITTGEANQKPNASKLVIDQIVSRTARLDIVPRDPRKLPRRFEIHNLVMQGVGDGDGATFDATLTNPIPRGEIVTHGTFGPWQADDPSQTPVRGKYTFTSANLNTIKGIGGMLSSVGTYSGVLERIDVKGETDTPDFSIDIAAQSVPLKTRFHAIVDGTNGDTRLERVEARLIETAIVTRGEVVRTKDVKGRRISLDVAINDGRIEDVLKLAVKAATPLMTGRMQLTAKLLLPAGDRDVIDKLELAGSVRLNEARFTNVNVQDKINALSQRGKGDETPANGPSVVSRLSGHFTLRAGTLTFSDLSFGVPGAIVQLAGTYNLKQETVDFHGNLLLDATLAETTSGWKAVVGRIAQPLFRRQGGGSKLPIRISGPRDQPEFGLDVGRALGPG